MRKFLAIFMAVVLVFCMAGVIGASELDQTATSYISYDVPGNFMIYVPMQINVGETTQIYAEEMNIPDGKMVEVSFAYFPFDDQIHLTNPNTEDFVSVYFKDASGATYSNSSSLIGTFDNTTADAVYSFTSDASYLTATTKAGTYTGSVDFYIAYVDAP